MTKGKLIKDLQNVPDDTELGMAMQITTTLTCGENQKPITNTHFCHGTVYGVNIECKLVDGIQTNYSVLITGS